MSLHLEHNVPLYGRTTLAVGGSAHFLAEVHTVEGLRDAVAFAVARQLPVLVLGGGSNMLVADAGFAGVVIQYCDQTLQLRRDGEWGHVFAGAGVVWDDLVAMTVTENLTGIESLSGIPGWVGAAPIQNIGAYGQEFSQCARYVHVFDMHTGATDILAAEACGFGYRFSHFKGAWQGRYVVTGVEIALRAGGIPVVRHAEVRAALPPSSTLTDVRNATLAIRASKSMVYDRNDPNHRSAGSFFMNPVVSEERARQAQAWWVAQGGDAASMPMFPGEHGMVKLSAAWLIERVGFPKGYVYGAAGLSSKHTLALINRGHAHAADMVALAAHIRRKVADITGIVLEPEPVFVGFSGTVDEILRAAE